MAFGGFEEVRVKATGEKVSLCKVKGDSGFHVDSPAAGDYKKCLYVETESGEIRAYLETALESIPG